MRCLPWHPWNLRAPQLEELQPFDIFIQDFAPALNDELHSGGWMAVVEQHPGPHVSLLTKSLDFCLCVKYSVCRTSVDCIANLRTSIIDAIRNAAKKMLTHRGAELVYRRNVSSATRVSHVEVDKISHEPLELRNNLQFLSILVNTQHIFKIRTNIF